MLNKIQYRGLVASGLMVGASMLFAGIAKAAPDGDVSASIAPIATVNYTAPSTTALPVAGISGMSFGTVSIQNNSVSGWTLTVDSANNGSLVKGSESISYTGLSATSTSPTAPTGAASINVSGTPATVATTNALACSSAAGCSYSLTANIGSVDGLSAGTYTDTLTFSFAAP